MHIEDIRDGYKEVFEAACEITSDPVAAALLVVADEIGTLTQELRDQFGNMRDSLAEPKKRT